MDDLEITKLCAQAMGYAGNQCKEVANQEAAEPPIVSRNEHGEAIEYDPLRDDAQAMALVKKFKLYQGWDDYLELWEVEWEDLTALTMDTYSYEEISGPDLNRAICECVAKMQAAKARA